MSEPAHNHEQHQMCLEHSPIEYLLGARLGIILRRRVVGVSVQVDDQEDGSALAVTSGIDHLTGRELTASYPGATKAQALLRAIEELEREEQSRELAKVQGTYPA